MTLPFPPIICWRMVNHQNAITNTVIRMNGSHSTIQGVDSGAR